MLVGYIWFGCGNVLGLGSIGLLPGENYALEDWLVNAGCTLYNIAYEKLKPI